MIVVPVVIVANFLRPSPRCPYSSDWSGSTNRPRPRDGSLPRSNIHRLEWFLSPIDS